MTFALLGIVLAAAAVVYAAIQTFCMILFIRTESFKQKKHKWQAIHLFWNVTKVLAALILAVVISAIVLGLVNHVPPANDTLAGQDESEIRRVVKESQVREFLEFYRNPGRVDLIGSNDYWLPGSEALLDIQICLKSLVTSHCHYGVGSRLLSFEFRYANVFGNRAEVGTSERWYLPKVHDDGSPVAGRSGPDMGPFDVDYKLRKVKGRWLLEFTTTPYLHKHR